MRFEELRPCDLCGSPVAGNARNGTSLVFYRVLIEHHVLDIRAVRERAGLTMMLGGSERLAGVLAARDEASTPAARRELLICLACHCDGKTRDLIETSQGRELPAAQRPRSPLVEDLDGDAHPKGA